jgi:hypothetical protein
MRPLMDDEVFCANAVETAKSEPITHGKSRMRSCWFIATFPFSSRQDAEHENRHGDRPFGVAGVIATVSGWVLRLLQKRGERRPQPSPLV